MKYDDFTALCDREWLKNCAMGEFRDVTGLQLTPASAAELAADVMGLPLETQPMRLHIRNEDVSAIRCGAAVTDMVNPVTRSHVMICICHDAPSDSLIVSTGVGTEEVPVT